MRKALGIIGLGRDRAVVLPVDGQGRIDPSDLPVLEGPALVCSQAGNVNTGAIDPFGAAERLGRRARRVDPRRRRVRAVGGRGAVAGWPGRGHRPADSWATDCHKWLNITYDCGVALVRDADALRLAMQASARTCRRRLRSDGTTRPQSSQRARGVEVWAALAARTRRRGRTGGQELPAGAPGSPRGCEAAGFDVLNEVVLNQVLVAFGSAARTEGDRRGPGRRHVLVRADDVAGRTAMRISVSVWSTTDDDIDRSIAAVRACAAA